MAITAQLYSATVMHKRLFPKRNAFRYSVYYVALPLTQLAHITALAINKGGVMSVRERDYGARDGTALDAWVRGVLADYGLSAVVQDIQFVTMPRLLGYGFNPVSFYLCFDAAEQVRAVVCEVHNTFGEAHRYVCAHPDHRVIEGDDWLEADKLFHVSPFLKREGRYRFRFAHAGVRLGIWIDYYDAAGERELMTSLTGTLSPLSRASLRRAFWAYPLVTMKAIMLIHWQALKLFAKGVRYHVKPIPQQADVSATSDVTKM